MARCSFPYSLATAISSVPQVGDVDMYLIPRFPANVIFTALDRLDA